jgi:hypothetical protein
MMGNLVYGDAQFDIELDDALLAHLQIVIGAKLRRNESFYFSWTAESSTGPRKNTIWLQHSIPLRYHYSDDSTHPIDRDLLERLAAAANTSNGLVATQHLVGAVEEQIA